MYALRYGTVPMVRSVGGLKDTIKDYGDQEGFGIRFDQAKCWGYYIFCRKAIDLYTNKPDLIQLDAQLHDDTSIIHGIHLHNSISIFTAHCNLDPLK